jgi:hypothetical protein
MTWIRRAQQANVHYRGRGWREQRGWVVLDHRWAEGELVAVRG